MTSDAQPHGDDLCVAECGALRHSVRLACGADGCLAQRLIPLRRMAGHSSTKERTQRVQTGVPPSVWQVGPALHASVIPTLGSWPAKPGSVGHIRRLSGCGWH